MENCLFCKIVKGEIPAQKVYEDESTLIFKDINPQAPLHYLAIPKKHYRGIQDVPEQESTLFQNLFAAISAVVKKEELNSKGYRLVVNYGDSAGQAVHHIHVHILSGRTLHWPPG